MGELEDVQDPHVYLLRQWTDDLILFTHTHAITDNERLARDARGIAVVDGQVQYLIVADDRLSGVQLADGRTVPRVALFIRPAPRAHRDGLAATLGCETLAEGLLRTDGNGRSSVPGVWAAGNATNPRAQVITAAAEGSAVAVAINTELVNNDLDTATRHAAAPLRRDHTHTRDFRPRDSRRPDRWLAIRQPLDRNGV